LIVATLSVVIAARNFEQVEGYTFEEYVRDFHKHYDIHDYLKHSRTFQKNLATIIAHNKNPVHTWKMAVNKFADLDEHQMKTFYGWNHKMGRAWRSRYPMADLSSLPPVSDLPPTVDWRNASIVTPVKDQGMCGSCWAFAATECIESNVAQQTGNLVVLSEQNMVDCTPNPQHCGGTGGCSGATAELGFSYVMDKGIASEDDYPYTGSDGDCDETIAKTSSISNFVVLPQNNYSALVAAVATVGPIAVTVAASPWSFYSSGVFTGCPKPNEDVDLNHGVQLVGYGTDAKDGDYWLVRNSWGEGWGEGGYIRIQKHSDGDTKWCGINHEPLDGSGCPGGPSQITVCGSCGIWYDTSFPIGGSMLKRPHGRHHSRRN